MNAQATLDAPSVTFTLTDVHAHGHTAFGYVHLRENTSSRLAVKIVAEQKFADHISVVASVVTLEKDTFLPIGYPEFKATILTAGVRRTLSPQNLVAYVRSAFDRLIEQYDDGDAYARVLLHR